MAVTKKNKNRTRKQSSSSHLPRVIILRGSPGVGKSTVSMKLASLLPCRKKAYIPIDNLQHLDLRNCSNDKFKLGIFHAAIVCRSFIQEGFDIVVDYVFDKDLDFFVDKLLRSHVGKLPPCKIQVFYIDANFETVKKRNKERRDPMPLIVLKKLYETCEKEKGTFFTETVIDSTKLTAKATAKKILESTVAIVGCKKDGTLIDGEL